MKELNSRGQLLEKEALRFHLHTYHDTEVRATTHNQWWMNAVGLSSPSHTYLIRFQKFIVTAALLLYR